jgi:hypothetical protein
MANNSSASQNSCADFSTEERYVMMVYDKKGKAR